MKPMKKKFDKQIISQIGDQLKANKSVAVYTPQFDRIHKLEINSIPKTNDELQAVIHNASQDDLIKMGCAVWDVGSSDHEYLKANETHYLFPREWFEYIPDGFEVVGIFGTKEKFNREFTDDDTRFGCLAYGFVRMF